MKKSLLIISGLFILLNSAIFAQITYDPGYYVNNNGDTIRGYIKNYDWKSNPESIVFRFEDSINSNTLTIDEIRAFGIGRDLVYRRYKVLIEVSDPNIENYSRSPEPEFIERTLLLKLLVGGKKQLYKYQEATFQCFFVCNEYEIPEQLIHRNYWKITKTDEPRQLKESNRFRNQLYVFLSNDCNKPEDFEKLVYFEDEIIQFFGKYYECLSQEPEWLEHTEPLWRNKFSLGLSVGINYSDVTAIWQIAPGNPRNFTMAKGIFPVAGLSFEYFLPFYRNKFSVLLQPYVNHYSGSGQINHDEIYISITSLNIPAGFRYSIYPHINLRVFADISFVKVIPISSEYDFKSLLYETVQRYLSEYSLGVQFKKKYSLSVHYQPSHYQFNNFYGVASEMQNSSLKFTYHFLK